MTKQIVQITIPDNLNFADLKLARDADGAVSFDWIPIERICEASKIDIRLMRDAHEDNVSALIVGWYHEHLIRGGARDPVQDDLMREVVLEDVAGQPYSHEPGRA